MACGQFALQINFAWQRHNADFAGGTARVHKKTEEIGESGITGLKWTFLALYDKLACCDLVGERTSSAILM